MKVVADLHIHSRFSRAVSSQMTIPTIADWAKKKGIDLVGTGDWTHPVWIRELMASLKESKEGIYKLKDSDIDTRFLLSTEISLIYSQDDKSRRIHLVIFAPSFKTVERINKKLVEDGRNLMSDGRPIIGMSARDFAQLIFDIDERCLIIPAHAWTPWFSLYGSKSGFDSIKECFGDLADKIYAIETGLSSDPAMNWRIAELQNRRIVSFSDAHSPQKLGREVTVFDVEKLNYSSIRKAIMGSSNNKIIHTIEFYPEEGKYHFTGHRNCEIVYSPKEARKLGIVCPVCGKKLTVGVMNRVEFLSSDDVETESDTDKYGVRWIKEKKGQRPPYAMFVSLHGIVGESINVGVGSKAVAAEYDRLVGLFGSELNVLLKTKIDDIEKMVDPKITDAIKKVRSGDISISPGYDGVFGEVKIWKGDQKEVNHTIDQGALF